MIHRESQRRSLTIMAPILAATAIVSCTEGRDMILEAKDVQFLKVEETRAPPAARLQVSGLAFHSSLGVTDINTTVSEKSLIILVRLGPSGRGASGNFSRELDIPETVDKVLFGKDKVMLWKRGAGALR